MKASVVLPWVSAIAAVCGAVVKRAASGFSQGQPIDGSGKGAPILGECSQLLDGKLYRGCAFHTNLPVGGTNKDLDLQNPDNLGQQSTDNGIVPNLKWSFSDSKTRILKGGWVREQVVTDLPASHDLSAAQQHLTKGSIRELHWHKVVRKLCIQRFVVLAVVLM